MRTITLSGGDRGGETIDIQDSETEILVGDCLYRVEGEAGIYTGKVTAE
jgi:hypothetical protein